MINKLPNLNLSTQFPGPSDPLRKAFLKSWSYMLPYTIAFVSESVLPWPLSEPGRWG